MMMMVVVVVVVVVVVMGRGWPTLVSASCATPTATSSATTSGPTGATGRRKKPHGRRGSPKRRNKCGAGPHKSGGDLAATRPVPQYVTGAS